MKKIFLIALVAMTVTACASDDQIAVLRDPDIGRLVRCVPDSKNPFRFIGIGESVDECVAFYRARGYVPVRKEDLPNYKF